MNKHISGPLVFSVLILGVIACTGGGSSSDTASPPATRSSPGGIYAGTVFQNGSQRTDSIVGAVTESGEGGFYVSSTGGIFLLQFDVSGSSATGKFLGDLPLNGPQASFPNGKNTESGTHNSSIVERSSLTSDYSTGTDVGHFSLTNSLATYTTPSSFAAIQGTYSGSESLAVGRYSSSNSSLSITVKSDGSFNASSSTCSAFIGTFSIIDTRYNIYRASGQANCGDGAVHSGFQGLAFITPAQGATASKLTFMTASAINGEFIAGTANKQ